jgi:hypothetical protein
MHGETRAAGTASSRGARPTRIAAALLAAFLVAVPALAVISSNAASDPDLIPNGNMTTSVLWNFTTPEDYALTGAAVEGGMGKLAYVNETTVETNSSDFSRGTLSGVDVTTYPGSIVLNNTQVTPVRAVIQPGPADGVDTYIDQNQLNSNYDGGDLRLDSETGREQRILMRFDLSSIPSQAEVWDAVLWLYMKPSDAQLVQFNIYAVSQPFVESEATWIRWQIGGNWLTPGGDYDPESFCRGVLNNTRDWHAFDISRLVEMWLKGEVSNNGLIMVPDPAPDNAVKNFMSSDEGGATTQRPKLVVNYTQAGMLGTYESSTIGPGTNCNFTFAQWSTEVISFATDEFTTSPLSWRWNWANDPVSLGGSYDVGATRDGWLHVSIPGMREMRDDVVGGSCLYQNITGDFEATLRLQEYFTNDSMGAGLLLMNDQLSWALLHKTGVGANGTVRVLASEGGVGAVVASQPWPNMTEAYLRALRTPTGFGLFSSTDGDSWVPLLTYAPTLPYMTRLKVGLCVFSGLAGESAVAEFDFMRIEPVATNTGMYLKLRTGNSTSLSDPSWQSWSDAIYDSSVAIGVNARYIQYMLSMNSSRDWVSPKFDEFTAYDERFSSSGTIYTGDYTPPDFRRWITIRTAEVKNKGFVEYSYSTDHGSSWVYVGTGGTYSILSYSPQIMMRVVIWTSDTLSTPEVDYVEVIYEVSVSGFYVSADQSALAGHAFNVTIEAKDASNATITDWSGWVTLHAMNSDGTGDAATELAVTSAYVPTGGAVTVSNEAYNLTETIRIRVTSGSAFGLSGPVSILPGPVSTVLLEPDITFMIEHTSQVFEARAYDSLGNLVPSATFAWSAEPGLGSLNSTLGSSVLLTTGVAGTGGHLNVTCQGVQASRYIDVLAFLYAPVISPAIEPQTRDEDYGEWSLDITDHVYDVEDPHSRLRWYIFGEDVVTVRGENRTGNMVITFATIRDLSGDDWMTLVVVDSDGMTATTPILVSIAPVNDAPTIDPIDPLTINFRVPYLYQFRYYIRDVDTSLDNLALSVDPASRAHCVIDRLAISFSYGKEDMGTTQIVVVTVSDGQLTASTTVAIMVYDNNVPQLAQGLPNQQLLQGQTLPDAFNLEGGISYFYDPDGDPLSYSAVSKHVIVNILPNHTVNLTAPTDWYGTEYVVFRATDPYGARAEGAIQVEVIRVDMPPVVGDVPDLVVRYDLRYDFDLRPYVHDTDDPTDSLHFSVDDPHLYFYGSVLSILYPASSLGITYEPRITVRDDVNSVSFTIRITVTSNIPPEMVQPLDDHSFQEDWPLRYPIVGGLEEYFSDEGSSFGLAFSAISWAPQVTATAVANATNSWSILFTTEPDYHGTSELTIRATDVLGGLVEDTITLTVVSVPDSPALDLPEEVFVTEGEQLVLFLGPYLTDPDSSLAQSDFAFSVQLGDSPAVMETYLSYIRALPGMIVFDFPSNSLGTARWISFEIEVSVTDQDGKRGFDTMTVTVERRPGEIYIPPWVYATALAGAAAAGGFSIMSWKRRKRPFVIHDMMLIHNDGFLIGRYAHHVKGEIDEQIMSGMLTAVLNFVEDSMAPSQDQLKVFGFKEYEVIVKRGSKAFVAVAFSGDLAEGIEQALQAFLDTFDRIYRKKLGEWSGDIETDFAGVEVLIKGFVKENSRGHEGRGKQQSIWVSNDRKSSDSPKK